MHTNLDTVDAPPALVDGADYTLCYEMAEELFGGETSYENHGNHEDLKKNKKKQKTGLHACNVICTRPAHNEDNQCSIYC